LRLAARGGTRRLSFHLDDTLLPTASAAVLLLPLALLHSRALADVLLSSVAVLFLLRCWAKADWSALRSGWFRLAALLWAWLLGVTLCVGSPPAMLQALVMVRLPVFALALQHWVLAEPATRRRLFWVVVAAAVWIALQCWQQYLLGTNIFGYPRWGDGALTGPFWKPRAGSAYGAVFFPAFLPLVMDLLDRTSARARLAAVLLLAISVATMVLIGQRMPTLLLLFGLLCAGLLLRRFRLPMLLAMLAGGVLLAATPVISPPTFQKLVLRFLEQMQHFPTSNYGLLYIRALVMVAAHPWHGLGFDGFRNHCAEPQYFSGIPWLGMTDAENGGLAGCNLHPHNYYLQMATDGGLPALLLFATLAALWLTQLARALAPRPEPLRVALFVTALLALWPLSSTTALFVLPTSGWLFLSLGWGLAEARTAAAARAGIPSVASTSHTRTPLADSRPKNVTA